MKASLVERSVSRGLAASLSRALVAAACVVIAACGGSADAPPPPETGPVTGTPPTITQQPANVSVTTGQPANFTVAATGTAPLAYQWQRDGVAIAGATAATYALPATVPGDSGATFLAVVSNAYGSATSNGATLTVTTSAPVLTISPQPANASVTAGAQARSRSAARAAAARLASSGSAARRVPRAFADITGATAASYGFATVLGDNGAQFRAVLDCSGQSTTPSSVATLTVSPPGSSRCRSCSSPGCATRLSSTARQPSTRKRREPMR